jgi:hypothetical protein
VKKLAGRGSEKKNEDNKSINQVAKPRLELGL